MKDRSLCIAISTVGELSKHLQRKLELYTETLNKNICFLVIAQKLRQDRTWYVKSRIKVVESKQVGLSKSRNQAIDETDSEWVWFQDDDIDINLENVNLLYERLIEQNPDYGLLRIGSLESRSKPFKNYSFLTWSTPLKAVKASSIELLFKVEIIKGYKLSFHPRLGLGTSLPSCEENLFLYQFLIKTRGRVRELLYYGFTAYHTNLPENRLVDFNKRALARGFFLSKLKIWHSLPLFIYWCLRTEAKGVSSRPARIKMLLAGYKKGLLEKSDRHRQF